MAANKNKSTQDNAGDFSRAAGEARPGLVAEFWDFLKHNKKWWLLPILIAAAGIGILIALGGAGLAPLIYPVF